MFRNAEIVELLSRRLADVGHEVPDKWWIVDSKNDAWAVDLPDREWQAHAIPRAIAQRHWGSIDKSDALILVSHPDNPMKFTGANVEVGYAIAKGIPVLSIGVLERSAMYCPIIQADSVPELIDLLDIIAVRERKTRQVVAF